MAFQKKTWKDRLVEFSGRRKLTRVSGTIDSQIIVDVTREEGTVSQVGDAFAEANMNDLENRIEEGFKGTVDKDNVLETIEELEANTEKGYLADALLIKGLNDGLGFDTKLIDGVPNWSPRGADTWSPFRISGTVYFKAGSTADFTEIIQSLGKNVSDYNSSNFCMVLANGSSGSFSVASSSTDGTANRNGSFAVSISYNNGTVTAKMNAANAEGVNSSNRNRSWTNIVSNFSIKGIIFDPSSDTPFAG